MIAPATIALVKERADIVAIIGEVVSLRRAGAALVGLCPFHSERTPSFTVNPGRNYYHCFGCKAGGGPVDFVMANRGLNFPEAVRELAGALGIDVEEGAVRDRSEADRAAKEASALYTVNNVAAEFYRACLWGGTTEPARGAIYARSELVRRDILAKPADGSPAGEALAAFRIGYAPAAWRSLSHYLERQGLPLADGEKAGLLVQKNGRFYDRFRHRLMFPVVDHLGRVVAFSGRTLDDPSPQYRDAEDFTVGEKPAKYTNSPETPIYTKGAALFGLWQARDAVRADGAVLVEGNFDVVSLHARGLKNVVAPLGTAFTEAQAKLLRRFSPTVVVAFDGDGAGRKATWQARTAVRVGRLDAKAISLPQGSDPDAFVQQRGVGPFTELVKHATGLREYLIEQLLRDGEGGMEARAKRVSAVVKMLGEEDDPSVREMMKVYADRLAGSLVVDGRAPTNLLELESSMRRAMRGAASRDAARPVAAPPADAVSFAVVGAVLDVPTVVQCEGIPEVLAFLEGDFSLAAAAAQRTQAEDVIDATPEALRPHVQQRLGAPVCATLEQAWTAIMANARKLWERTVVAREGELRAALKEAERAGNEAEVERILSELTQVMSARVR